jgi:hypothetical protein
MSGALTLYVVEEGLSFLFILLWVGGGGAFVYVVLILKRALAPFHFWFIKILRERDGPSFIWGITFHKVPIIGVFIRACTLSLLPLLFFRLVGGAVLFLYLREINDLLFLSSRNTLVTFLILVVFYPFRAFIVFLLYRSVLWGVCFYIVPRRTRVCLMVGLIGLPPFLLFQLK